MIFDEEEVNENGQAATHSFPNLQKDENIKALSPFKPLFK